MNEIYIQEITIEFHFLLFLCTYEYLDCLLNWTSTFFFIIFYFLHLKKSRKFVIDSQKKNFTYMHNTYTHSCNIKKKNFLLFVINFVVDFLLRFLKIFSTIICLSLVRKTYFYIENSFGKLLLIVKVFCDFLKLLLIRGFFIFGKKVYKWTIFMVRLENYFPLGLVIEENIIKNFWFDFESFYDESMAL